MNEYDVLGMMSGTSLDGVDIAHCRFTKSNNGWKFKLNHAETFPYENRWVDRLQEAFKLSKENLLELDEQYGKLLGGLASKFILKHNIHPDFISSHGHTIYHQPEIKKTLQIGKGIEIARRTQLAVVNDFRSLDVSLEGQGAPLVPIGDRYLFSEFDYCLNLGGFANISFEDDKNRLAYDICPVNIILNAVCKRIGKQYDENGLLAASGQINEKLFDELNNIRYYKNAPPKTLSREWVESNIDPIINKYNISVNDLLHTLVEHCAAQIGQSFSNKHKGVVLVTGGGAHNSYLIQQIQKKSISTIKIPEKKIIDYKEALVFAFLGVLKTRNEVNCLKSVTGAMRDSSGGIINYP